MRLAAAAGVQQALALSYYDTVDGVSEWPSPPASATASASSRPPSSPPSGDREDMHILGYLVDHTDPALLAALERFRADRVARASRSARKRSSAASSAGSVWSTR